MPQAEGSQKVRDSKMHTPVDSIYHVGHHFILKSWELRSRKSVVAVLLDLHSAILHRLWH
jgi:hypothetical protein